MITKCTGFITEEIRSTRIYEDGRPPRPSICDIAAGKPQPTETE